MSPASLRSIQNSASSPEAPRKFHNLLCLYILVSLGERGRLGSPACARSRLHRLSIHHYLIIQFWFRSHGPPSLEETPQSRCRPVVWIGANLTGIPHSLRKSAPTSPIIISLYSPHRSTSGAMPPRVTAMPGLKLSWEAAGQVMRSSYLSFRRTRTA
jgi:hypothetical protein